MVIIYVYTINSLKENLSISKLHLLCLPFCVQLYYDLFGKVCLGTAL